jgi:predicted enzyme related to lactoylglutathione lyase
MHFNGICLITTDVPRLADFYSRLLGVEAVGDETHVELSTDGAGLTLFSIQGMEGMAPGSMLGAGYGSCILGIRVADVDDEFTRIQELGAAIVMPPTSHPWGARSFWFRDPDGNIIDFYQDLG